MIYIERKLFYWDISIGSRESHPNPGRIETKLTWTGVWETNRRKRDVLALEFPVKTGGVFMFGFQNLHPGQLYLARA